MPDSTPQEQPKPTPKKEEGKSLFARLFKKKDTSIPEGARPVEMPKPAENPVAAPAPNLPSIPTAPLKKETVEPAKEKTPAPVPEEKKQEISAKTEPSKLFRSLELFKKDREERMAGMSPVSPAKPEETKKPSDIPPKNEPPKFPIQPPLPSKVEVKKEVPEEKKEDKKQVLPPPLIPLVSKKTEPTGTSSIFIPKVSVPEPVKIQKPAAAPQEAKSPEVGKEASVPISPAAEKDKSGEKTPQISSDKEEKKEDAKATVSKMEAGKPRQRRDRPIVDIPASTGRREERSVGLFNKRIIFIMGAILLSLGIFSLWFLLRETRLQVNIAADGVELSPQVYVVYDFTDRVEMIRRNLAARRAPVRELLDDALASLNASQADYSGKAQRKKMLQENISKDQAEIPAMLNRTRSELETLWDKESKTLDKEYSAAKDEFSKTVEDKAKALGLKYNPNPELNEPEVAVNAFRLSLYGAQKGVDVTAQRKWAEELLSGWREKEKIWAERRQKIRKEADGLRAPVGGMIDEIKKRAEFLQSQISEVDEELALIQNEVNGFQDRVASYQKEMEDLIRPFYDELTRVPGEYKKTIYSMSSPGKVDVREMEKTKEMPPGTYKLLVRGTKDGQEYWALVNFEIKQYKNNQVEVKSSDFKPARKLIE